MIRLVSGATVAAVTTASAFLINGVASAAVPQGSLGSLTVSPGSGTDTAAISSTTSAGCPSQTGAVDQSIVGPVGPDGITAPASATFPSSSPYQITGTTTHGFSTSRPFTLQFGKTLADAATDQGTQLQPGEYHVTVECTDRFDIATFGTFTGGLAFSDTHNYTVISPPTPTPTPTPT
ncbi:MAG: hypothetical protein QOH09_1254, partial [Pseudonocardiales bacterium]|nr:hypothetical protein [Pseudonocardiales bacterium]